MHIVYALFLILAVSVLNSYLDETPIKAIFKSLFRAHQHKSPKPINSTFGNSGLADGRTIYELTEIIRNLDFFGSWFSTNTSSPPLSFFSENYGYLFTESLSTVPEFTKMKFRRSLRTDRISPKELISDVDFLDILIKLYDGKYIDEKSANLYLYITSSSIFGNNTSNSTLSLSGINAQLELKEVVDSQTKLQSCLSDVSIFFLNSHTGQPLDPTDTEPSDISLQIQLVSEECNLSLLTTMLSYKPAISTLQILGFLGLMSMLGICHCIAAYKMKKSLRTRRMVYQVSIMSVWLIASTDYYLLILNLVLAFAISIYFILPICIFVLLNFHFERELIIKLSDSRRRRNSSDDDWRGCGLSFAVASVLFLVELIGVIMGKLWIIQLSSLIYIPQIIHNQTRKKRFILNKYYLFLFGLPRLVFVSYIKGYADNILKMTPDYLFVGLYASSLLLQIFIIFLQYKFPNMTINRSFKVGPQCDKSHDDVCSICYEELLKQNYESASNLEARILEIRSYDKDTIQIKCGHLFHLKCIIAWAKQRSVCPLCREDIEDILEEFDDDSSISSEF